MTSPYRCETCSFPKDPNWVRHYDCPYLRAAIDEDEGTPKKKLLPGRDRRHNFTEVCGCASHSLFKVQRLVGIHCPVCGFHQIVPMDEWHFQSIEGHGHTCGSGKCPSHTYMVLDDCITHSERILKSVKEHLDAVITGDAPCGEQGSISSYCAIRCLIDNLEQIEKRAEEP